MLKVKDMQGKGAIYKYLHKIDWVQTDNWINANKNHKHQTAMKIHDGKALTSIEWNAEIIWNFQSKNNSQWFSKILAKVIQGKPSKIQDLKNPRNWVA